MGKRVTLKLNDGSLETGFFAILQIGEEGATPTVEISGQLPAAFYLQSVYKLWQTQYGQLSTPKRIIIDDSFATNVSRVGDCLSLAEELRQAFNQWLQSEAFRPLQDKLLEQLNPNDTIQFILQTGNTTVQRLPWHLWDICDRYPKLEIALSAPAYEKRIAAPPANRSKIRILAVFGHSEGLDTQTDRTLLDHLPNAEVQFLTEPTRQTLAAHLWEPQGWDMFFFAGHSASSACQTPANQTPANQTPANQTSPNQTPPPEQGKNVVSPARAQTTIGKLYINPTESITIPQLKNALRKALTRGLKIAFFNSCDGIGLAQALSDLHISQILVMREPIPDPVAHTFLKSFLEAFSRGESFSLAVRESREKLQALEDHFPCASWLPTIYQNPAEASLYWSTLLQRDIPNRKFHRRRSDRMASSPPSTAPAAHPPRLSVLLVTHLFVIAGLLGLRALGLFQSWELMSLDQFLRSRPAERPDPRLVVVTITPEDIQVQDAEDRRGSLSDPALLKVLQTLEPFEPRVIGLDIYRDFPVRSNLPELATKLNNTNNLFAVCKSRNARTNSDGIAAPPELPPAQVGFSDFVVDPDGIVRRQLLSFTPEPSTRCPASYSLNALVALKYLETEGYPLAVSPEGYLQVGEVTFPPIEPTKGGYQTIDALGHQLLLNYRSLESPDQIADRITLTELIEGNINPAAIRDRIVLIGTTDNSYPDDWQTPYSLGPNTEHRTSGVFMQAQMTSQLISAVLDERPLLTSWTQSIETLWIILWGGIGSLIIINIRQSQSVSHRNHLANHPANHRARRQLLLALLATELGLLGMCWLLLVKSNVWVPWAISAIAPIAVASSHPISNRLSAVFNAKKG